jgi:hypothetical protein
MRATLRDFWVSSFSGELMVIGFDRAVVILQPAIHCVQARQARIRRWI